MLLILLGRPLPDAVRVNKQGHLRFVEHDDGGDGAANWVELAADA